MVSRPPATPNGQPLRVLSRYQIRGAFADGTFLGVRRMTERPQADQTVVFRDTLPVVRIGSEEAEKVDPLGVIPGDEYYQYFDADGGFSFGSMLSGYVEALAAAGDRYFVGTGEHFEISEHAPDGRLIRLFRLCQEPHTITRERTTRMIEEYVATLAPNVRRSTEEALRHVVQPRIAPANLNLLVDIDEGHLWIRAFTYPGEFQRWHVLDRDGRWLRTVRTPPDLSVLQAGSNWILGLQSSGPAERSVHLYYSASR